MKAAFFLCGLAGVCAFVVGCQLDTAADVVLMGAGGVLAFTSLIAIVVTK